MPDKDKVRSVLEPYHPRIRSVVERAWAEWRAVSAFRTKSKFSPLMYPRTVANYVFDAIARYAIAEFASDDRVHVRVEPQTVKFFFGGSVLGRFKKGDENKLGSNIETQAVIAFIEADGVLPGLPSETAKVEFIWLPNEIQTQIDKVLVVARDGDHLEWEYEIEPASGAEIIPLPTQPRPPTLPPDGHVFIKPKVTEPKKTENE
ncbi:MAG: hypothetical protein ACHQAY_21220 [Hyphomicrobiales bacterium]